MYENEAHEAAEARSRRAMRIVRYATWEFYSAEEHQSGVMKEKRKTDLRENIEALRDYALARIPNGVLDRLEYQLKRAYPGHDGFRCFASGMLTSDYGRPAQLLLLGQYSAAYFESHAILERFVISRTPRLLSDDSHVQASLAKLLERRTLSDLWPLLVHLKRWDIECAKFIAKLTRIRNAIAHKNDELLDRTLGKIPKNHFGRDDPRFSEDATIAMLLDCIELTLRGRHIRKSIKWRKLTSSLSAVKLLYALPEPEKLQLPVFDSLDPFEF